MSPTLYQVSEATNILKKVLRGHKETTCNAGDLCSIPGSGRSPGEGMATHSSILAWNIPWAEEPGGL